MLQYYLILGVGVVGLGVSAIFAKITSAPSEIIGFYRLFFTFILTLPLILKTKKIDWSKINLKDFGLLFCAAFFLCFYLVTWFTSLRYTSVASSTVLVNIHPIFVILFSLIFWHKGLSSKTIFSVVVSILGIVILNWSDFSLNGKNLWGNFLAILGALFFTGNLVCTTHLRNKLDIIPYSIILYGFCSIILAIYTIISGTSFTGYTSTDYLMFLLLAVCSTILGQTLVSWCLKYLSITLVSLSTLGEPVVAAVWAYFVFQENISLTQAIGVVLVLLGIAYYGKTQKNKEKEEE